MRPVAIETLSTLPIERQIGAEAATWLDRQLTREVSHEGADYGFGRDVRQALARRQQWLIEQGLMQRDGKRGKSRGSQAVAQRCLTIAGKYGTSGWFGTARREPR